MPSRFARATVCLLLLAASVLGAAAEVGDPRVVMSLDPLAIGAFRSTRLSLYLTSREAAALVVRLPDVLLIDVRPVAEVERVGLPEAVHRNVPLLVADPPSGRGAVRQNERLVQSVEDFAGGPVAARRRTIMLICVSGVHSAQASDLLAEAGFERVYSVVDGYDGDSNGEATKGDAPQKALNGWRALALPWRDRPRSDQAWPTSP